MYLKAGNFVIYVVRFCVFILGFVFKSIWDRREINYYVAFCRQNGYIVSLNEANIFLLFP